MKINEVKEILSQDNPNEKILEQLRNDERSGVQKLLASFDKKQEKKLFYKKEYEKKSFYENKCYNKGCKYICGIDEVGRGPLAGPVVAAAVILKQDSYFEGLNDSKKLSEKKREELFEKIKEEAVAYAICEVSNEEIERYNIYNAARIAMQRAVEQLKVRPDFLLIDAMPFENYPIPNFSMVKGDEKSVSIAAASVIAKVYRDRLMKEYAKKYPHYDFENNAGYGTKKHLEGLKAYGITPIHRRDFEPVKSMIKQGGNNE
ncbi:ribonuclease HII [Gemella morbillorum]|uniref:ribonuclease HII n=1 Tax=Gemella morbillorum TaxID=29391 RepID=UPI0023F27D1F|nr:ribonuclease HII [Gemella morbillorum]